MLLPSGATVTTNGSPGTGMASTAVPDPRSTTVMLSENWSAMYARVPAGFTANPVGMLPTVTPRINPVSGSVPSRTLAESATPTTTTE